MTSHSFSQFLNTFTPKLQAKSRQHNQAFWLLCTTGSKDATDLKATLDAELRSLYNDPSVLQQLQDWSQNGSITDPIDQRQLNVLIRLFKQNTIPQLLLEEIAKNQALVGHTYINFRALFEGVAHTENELKNILKTENDPTRRQKVWEATKQIGEQLAPQILTLVKLRNEAAKVAGYDNYFNMQLDLLEVSEEKLFHTLEELIKGSENAFTETLEYIENQQVQRFGVSKNELGPWAWSEPFCQEDPIQCSSLDALVNDKDLFAINTQFYQNMGMDISPVVQASDLFERPGKNQHAFCLNVDRKGDIRTLNNVKPTITWLEVLLHEFGHAIYEMGLDQNLPWLLREPPHMITTEAMALVAGRQTYRASVLQPLVESTQQQLIAKAEQSLTRRQLIFSRWVLVMTHFERELYSNPDQDLNTLWWQLVHRFQRIPIPKRTGKSDWAAKVHIGLAPVYYYSYLLGEMFASQIEETLEKQAGSKALSTPEAGRYLKERLFKPANSMNWSKLIQHVVAEPLSPNAWLRQFADAR